MGTGKTSAGRLLAKRSGRDFEDTDEMIVERTGRNIADIFGEDGQAAFRSMERRIARELAGRKNLVIATGGRLMLDPLNATLLGPQNIVICLIAEPWEILARLASDGGRRPLLETPDPEKRVIELLAERSEGYGQYHQIRTSNQTVEAVAGELLNLVGRIERSGKWHQPFVSLLPVKYPGGRYQVMVGHGVLGRLQELAGVTGPTVVVTDSNVQPLHAGKLSGINPISIITVPAGEEFKTLDTIQTLYQQFLVAGLDREGSVVALGGGVTGDMAGFAASTYMRGVGFVQCPTTVLSIVDASVGGKTGVDLPQGKNLVGAFKQPLAVLADLDTLNTLPEAEFRAGMAEVVKHGLISRLELLARLEDLVDSGRWAVGIAQENDGISGVELQSLMVEAILIKRDVVEADPFESGRRKVLNLGHTFGHAIEQVSQYKVSHGEGVAIGLVAAAAMSADLGFCLPDIQRRIERLLVGLALPIRIPDGLSHEALIEAMASDKKKASGRLQFVLLRNVGDVFISDRVTEKDVKRTLQKMIKHDN